MENSNNYSSSYKQTEIIKKIENFGGKYDSTSTLPIDDQLSIYESLAQENHTYTLQEKNNDDGNVNVSGNGNGSYKLNADFKLTTEKLTIIKEISTFNYKVPIYKLASSLEQLFSGLGSESRHWTYTAERYPPRAINSVINTMTKQYGKDWKNLNNPAAYFTKVIKFRKKRKKYQ